MYVNYNVCYTRVIIVIYYFSVYIFYYHPNTLFIIKAVIVKNGKYTFLISIYRYLFMRVAEKWRIFLLLDTTRV